MLPLDELQKRVLAALMPLRSPDSVFARGSVLQRHGFRLSDDQDLFHHIDADVLAIAERDATVLRTAGFAVDLRDVQAGMVEAYVGHPDFGMTRLQWVEAGAWNFFAPVPDNAFGWRLHMADLAVNKVLAAAGRRRVRDYVDLAFIHEHVMPLWHAIWAAPGKDENWSPCSLAEKIAMTNAFRQIEVDEDVVSLIPVSAADVGRTVRAAIEEARDVFERLPDEAAGKLFIDANGSVVNDLGAILAVGSPVQTLGVRRGGAWPSGPDIDAVLIRRVVDAFGWEGARLLR